MLSDKFIAKPGKAIKLSEIPTLNTLNYKSKDETKKLLRQNIKKLTELQSKLYAHNKYSVLIIFQAMDAAGKDSTIKHVMSGLNPQGTEVYSFKQPSTEEIDHDYLWRIHKAVPERGRIGIFNRSHYEDVLIVRVHNIIKNQNLPEKTLTKDIWQRRFRQILDFEKNLYENGTIIIKFFLHVSKEEQKKRFLKRIDKESKNWKFSAQDVEERKYWNDYQKCYEETVSATSKTYSPWFIIPADNKWFMQFAVSQIIAERLEDLDISYPKLSREELNKLESCRKQLLDEK